MINNVSERLGSLWYFRESAGLSSFSLFRPYTNAILATVLILITAIAAAGQSTGSPEEAAVNPVLCRIERVRALAAAQPRRGKQDDRERRWTRRRRAQPFDRVHLQRMLAACQRQRLAEQGFEVFRSHQTEVVHGQVPSGEGARRG